MTRDSMYSTFTGFISSFYKSCNHKFRSFWSCQMFNALKRKMLILVSRSLGMHWQAVKEVMSIDQRLQGLMNSSFQRNASGDNTYALLGRHTQPSSHLICLTCTTPVLHQHSRQLWSSAIHLTQSRSRDLDIGTSTLHLWRECEGLLACRVPTHESPCIWGFAIELRRRKVKAWVLHSQFTHSQSMCVLPE